ncbi:hypothetical protein PN462_04240 [Spirulina sp. CS-785/01]|uniref:hypothetical protein n=1 Tax=Spirulina sp. CS-785/01 TaxID=3021716 RepID=UPI002330EBC2|nr:hypothetical protein [Spirulina sp. CS-785/01]MDB9312303.1 hypothetical protein [Spirulina sp. CS-785/01]
MLQRLVFMVLIATMTLFTVLMVTPVRASQSTAPAVYAWSYTGVGAAQRVCKQTVLIPTSRFVDGEREQVKVMTKIVRDRYCQK